MTHHAQKIQQLNDAFRKTGAGGRFMMTAGVGALPQDVQAMALLRVRTFSAFTEDNHEHDFGSFELFGRKFFFKLDYYDRKLEFGSEDPADPAVTTRVLTLMLAEEYSDAIKLLSVLTGHTTSAAEIAARHHPSGGEGPMHTMDPATMRLATVAISKLMRELAEMTRQRDDARAKVSELAITVNTLRAAARR
jgi:hypothetical protein